MNHWDVYEWIKERYMWTGNVPPQTRIFRQFCEFPGTMVFDGMDEFEKTVGVQVPPVEWLGWNRFARIHDRKGWKTKLSG